MLSLRKILKNLAPYGMTCAWKRRRYGIIEDQPLFYYPGFGKRVRRIVKFLLPYGFVVRVRRPGVGRLSGKPLHPMLSSPVPREDLGLLREKVLIVAELSIPQCRYYRVEQKVAMLRENGVSVAVENWTDFHAALAQMQTATLVIFYRVPYTDEVAALYAEARRLGLKVGFDIDDLVFDIEEYSKNSNLKRLSRTEQKGLLDGAQLYQKALAAADFSIASTPCLQTYMQKYCKGPSTVIPNCIMEGQSQDETLRLPLGQDDRIVIGYGSGTTTHNEDFKLCADALLRIMREFRDVVFVLHGMLELPDSFETVKNRIIRIDFVPFEQYSRAISRFDINLIPLEPGVFNDCKSNIKYLEASRMGVPSVASPLAEFRSVIRNGENGFLASTEEQWYAALRQLVLSAELRKCVGAAARETVMATYGAQIVWRKKLLPLLRGCDGQRPSVKRKRVLVVNVLYPPMSFGGATVLCENLVADYRKSVDVCVFTMSMDVRHAVGHLTRYNNRGEMCFLVELQPSGKLNQDWDVPEAVPAFKSVCEAFKPDIVHFHSIQFLGLQIVEFCKQASIPYVVTAHDAWWICPRQFMLDRAGRYCAQDERGIDLYRCVKCANSKTLFVRWSRMQKVLMGAEVILTPSDYQTALYVKSGYPAEKVKTNRNGIHVPATYPSHRLNKPITFAYIGGKCAHKGYFFLKNVMARVHGEYKLKLVDLEMTFGGRSISGAEWSEPLKIEIVSPFDHHAMEDFYAGIDVLLFPSCWKESFGLTIREALARNIWVISTDAGGDIGRDLKCGENGDLIAMGDEEGFAAAMQRLIDDLNRLKGFDNPYRKAITAVERQVEDLARFLLD